MGPHGLEKVMNLRITFLISITAAFSYSYSNEEEAIVKRLNSNSWDSISISLTQINRNAEKLKSNDKIRSAIVKLFHSITLKYRNPSDSTLEKVGDSGEIEGDIAFLIVKTDISEALPDLIDWVDNSPAFMSYAVRKISNEDCQKNIYLDTLKYRFDNKEDYFFQRKTSYFTLTCSLQDSMKTACQKLNTILKEMILDQIKSNCVPIRSNAIKCSSHLLNDPQIIQTLQNIALQDPYAVNIKGIKKYPLRDEARLMLSKQK